MEVFWNCREKVDFCLVFVVVLFVFNVVHIKDSNQMFLQHFYIPVTFWMIFATKALKWHRISFNVSESFSFSASRSCLVRSTYSSKVLLRECVSLSRPPLALKNKIFLKNQIVWYIQWFLKTILYFFLFKKPYNLITANI